MTLPSRFILEENVRKRTWIKEGDGEMLDGWEFKGEIREANRTMTNNTAKGTLL